MEQQARVCAAHLVEGDALASQMVDVVAQHFVAAHSLVELDERRLDSVLQKLDLLRNRLRVVLGGIDAWRSGQAVRRTR